MAHKDQAQKQKKIQFQTPKIIKITIWGVIAVIAIIIGILLWPETPSAPTKTLAATASVMPDYPLCPDTDNKDFYLNDKNKSATFRVLLSCWSPKVNITAHTDFDIVVSERIEGIQFWNGEIWDRETILYYLKKKDGWMGKLKYSAFRLRGVGEAKVSI